jgi:PAS domain S-box-containing protein
VQRQREAFPFQRRDVNPEGHLTPRGSPQRSSATAGKPNPAVTVGSDVLNELASGVLVVSADRRITLANRACASLLGQDAAAITGKRIADVWPALERALPSGTTDDSVTRGRIRQCSIDVGGTEVRVHIAPTGAGGFVLEVGAGTTSDALRLQHNRLLEEMSDGVCLVNSAGRITSWNRAAERMTSVPGSEMVGRFASEVFPGIRQTSLAASVRETARSGNPREVRGFTYSGDDLGRGAGIYDTSAHRIDDGGLLVIFREVSEKVRQEVELHSRSAEAEQLRRLARALAEVDDSSSLLHLLADSAIEQTVAAGSAVIEVVGGMGRVTVVAGEHAPEPGSELPLAESASGRAIASRETIRVATQADLPSATRSEKRGPVIVTPLVAHDKVLGALSVWRAAGAEPFDDRDAEKLRTIADHASLALWKLRLIDEAHAASRAKDDFMATISHELRTPLTALTGYGELLAEQIAGPLEPQQLEMVERMRAVTNHLTVIIDEILTFASIEAGRERLRTVTVDAAGIVAEATAVVEPLARQKGISFRASAPPSITLRSDPDKVRQILVNLLGNAVKFTDSGSVELACTSSDGSVCFAIRDTGIGISEEEQGRLFQPFTQLAGGLTRRHGGTGLGLFISNRLAALLGGRLQLESTPGKGSTFTLIIPLESGAPDSRPAPSRLD